jgi:hypothetical protein
VSGRTTIRRAALGIAAAVSVALAAGGLSACASIRNLAAPTCSSEHIDPLILEAQAVPTASRMPCIANYPAGWSLGGVDIESGSATFSLNSDRAGTNALEVTLTEHCDTDRTTEVASDEPGARRYERILSIENGMQAERFYRFRGGCATYRFDYREAGRALVNEASTIIAFVTRDQLNERLARHGFDETL